jgi:GNAT superfamily N-acetyltransferase
MEPYEVVQGDYLISTDKRLLDFDVIHGFLTTSYWSPGIPMDIVKQAAAGSLVFGVYLEKKQVGYARLITDRATFAYLADVFIIPAEQGKGLSKWLVETIFKMPGLQGFRRCMLATRDAHGLYAQFGFQPLAHPEFLMEITRPNIYLEPS